MKAFVHKSLKVQKETPTSAICGAPVSRMRSLRDTAAVHLGTSFLSEAILE